jgi:hypothetical protein
MAVIGNIVQVYWAPTSGPLSTTPTWTDITSKVQDVRISGGRSGAFDQYQPRRCQIQVNNLAGTVDPTKWYRWRQLKVEASVSGGTYVLFSGFIQTVEHDQSQAPRYATATIDADDLLSILSRREIAYGVPYGDSAVATEPVSDRVNTILTAANIPAGFIGSVSTTPTLISAPSATVNGNDTTGVLVGNALELLQDCAECDLGALYTRGGAVYFENRWALVNRAASPGSYPTFSDTPTGTNISILRGNVTLTPPGTDYRNLVSYTGTSGTAKTASYTIAQYPYDSLSRTLPLELDQQALGNSQGLLEVYRQQKVWPAQIGVHLWPNADQNLVSAVGIQLRDYAVVKFTPVGQSQQTYKVFVSEVVHEIGPGRWNMTVSFESADRWYDAWVATGTFLKLNDATAGQLDQEVLAF